MNMPLEPSWSDIVIRLALTMLAGAVIGFNREARGQSAGFRTTILVGLAASVAMIQANILLSVSGKTAQSFGVMDLMRLPLGILTGVGFIGAGTIIKRGDLVTGVTTAATLWLITVIGLCLGGGQLVLGSATTVLGVFTLWALSWVDIVIPRDQHARLVVTCDTTSNVLDDIPRVFERMNLHARFHAQRRSSDPGKADYTFEVSWRRSERATPPIELLRALDGRYQVKLFELTAYSGR